MGAMEDSDSWFSIDKEGLAEQLERRGRPFAVLELLQNALDESGVTEVNIVLTPVKGKRVGYLSVIDNAPAGYADLSHAYTFFARSTKSSNPEKRGRFNSGEKLVLAICDWAEVTTTTGGVRFDIDGRRKATRKKTEVGSTFEAEVRMSRADIAETEVVVATCVIPPHITVTFNGEKIAHREPVHVFGATLDTEVDFRSTRRKTTVSLHEPVADRGPYLYEMGIPVVSHDGRWDVNIAQRVPLNSDRDNVTPAYLRKVHQFVLENTTDLITEDDANSVWVKSVLPQVAPEVAKEVFLKRYGPKTAVFDVNDQEANKRLQDEGYTLIYGRSISKEEHEALRRADVFKPSGVIRPTGLETSLDGQPPIPVDDWTPAMHHLADYTRGLGVAILGFEPVVEFQNMPMGRRWGGSWGNRTITFNIGQLGRRWVEDPDQEKVDSLIIHEFAHHYEKEHFTDRYIAAVCDVGAKLRGLSDRLEAPQESTAR